MYSTVSTNQPLAICLMGPTASGKTAIAIALHERFPVEIISVDASQIYRGMDIGTAKPTIEERTRAPHRLIDIRDPAQGYSAAHFRGDALREMRAVSAAGKIPLLVGGTMFYFRLQASQCLWSTLRTRLSCLRHVPTLR